MLPSIGHRDSTLVMYVPIDWQNNDYSIPRLCSICIDITVVGRSRHVTRQNDMPGSAYDCDVNTYTAQPQ